MIHHLLGYDERKEGILMPSLLLILATTGGLALPLALKNNYS